MNIRNNGKNDERIGALSEEEAKKLETAYNLADRGEEFAKLFCRVAKEYTAVKELLAEMLEEILNSDAKEPLKNIVKEVFKEDWKAFMRSTGGRIAFGLWSIGLIVLGAWLGHVWK